jgi:chromosome segregation ATPase
VSERLDKLRRLQGALDDLLAAVREVDQNLDSSEAADLQSVIDEMEEESVRSKMSIEARDRELKEWNRMWHEQVDEVKRLQAENERLRNDANELADNLEKAAGNTASHYNCLIKWRAAKGGQS